MMMTNVSWNLFWFFFLSINLCVRINIIKSFQTVENQMLVVEKMLNKRHDYVYILNTYHENNDRLILETPRKYYSKLTDCVGYAIVQIFYQDNSIKDNLIHLTVNLVNNFDDELNSEAAWYALSILYNETKSKSGYTFLHKVIIGMNNEIFEIQSDDKCKPMANLLYVASTRYNVASLIDAKDREGRTPLAVAIMLLEYCAIDLLLKHGANANLVQISFGSTDHQPLSQHVTQILFFQQILSILELHKNWAFKKLLQTNQHADHIFENKINIESQKLWGLSYPTYTLEFNVSKKIYKRIYWDELSSALAPRTKKVFSILFHHIPQYLFQKDYLSRTPLHYAAMDGNLIAVKLFLEKGIDMHQKDTFLKTAGSYAYYNGYNDIAKLLYFEKENYEKEYIDDNASLVCDKKNEEGSVINPNSNEIIINNTDMKFALLNDVDAGGWSRAMIKHDSNRCDIKEVYRSDKNVHSIIFEHFIIKQQPIIVRDCFDAELKYWRAVNKWKKKDIIDAYGQTYTHSCGKIPYSQLYGGETLNGPYTLEQYINYFLISNDTKYINSNANNFTIFEPPLYWFKALMPPYDKISSQIISEDIEELKVLGNSNYTVLTKYYQHFIGAIASGSSPHLHNSAWNILVYGKKLWYIWRPKQSFISNVPTLDYVRNEPLKKDHSMRCVQNKNDLVLIPKNWGHSTFSLSENVGIAAEFDILLH